VGFKEVVEDDPAQRKLARSGYNMRRLNILQLVVEYSGYLVYLIGKMATSTAESLHEKFYPLEAYIVVNYRTKGLYIVTYHVGLSLTLTNYRELIHPTLEIFRRYGTERRLPLVQSGPPLPV
jgi:hypothetical protein